jgi:hypothetical protein
VHSSTRLHVQSHLAPTEHRCFGVAVVEKEVAAICGISNTVPNLSHEYWIVGVHCYIYEAYNALQAYPNNDNKHDS